MNFKKIIKEINNITKTYIINLSNTNLEEDVFGVGSKSEIGQRLLRKNITKIAIEEGGEPQDLEKGDKIRSSGWIKYGRGGWLNGNLYILDQSNGGGGHTNGTENGFYWGVKQAGISIIKDPYEDKNIIRITPEGKKENVLFIKSRAGGRFADGGNKPTQKVLEILSSIVKKL